MTAEPPIVVIAEDDPLIRDILVRLFQSRGVDAHGAREGGRALDLVRSFRGRVLLVVTDLQMPGVDGLELAARLAAECPEVPVLFCSAAVPPGEVRALVRSGYVAKPFQAAQLWDAVQALAPSLRCAPAVYAVANPDRPATGLGS